LRVFVAGRSIILWQLLTIGREEELNYLDDNFAIKQHVWLFLHREGMLLKIG
jgi:hypothetical protein